MKLARPEDERVQYAVVRVEGDWRIVCLGWRAERFAELDEALLAAERLAQETQSLGVRVEVLLKGGRDDAAMH